MFPLINLLIGGLLGAKYLEKRKEKTAEVSAEKSNNNDNMNDETYKLTMSKCFKLVDVEKHLEEVLHREYRLSYEDSKTVVLRWVKTGSSDKEYWFRIIIQGVDGLYVKLAIYGNAHPFSLFEDMKKAYSISDNAVEIWQNPAINEPGAGAGYNVAIQLDKIPLTKDFAEAHDIQDISFDEENICVACQGKLGKTSEGEMQAEALGFMLQGSAYESSRQYDKAAECYRMAAERENATAQTNLGFLLWNGLGVERNLEEAYQWFCKAAKQMEQYALYNLGEFYAQGLVVKENKTTACIYYKAAAEKGNKDAMLALGMCYLDGKGVEKDANKAFDLFVKAAEAGQKKAQELMGYFYHDGIGFQKDYAKALEWYTKAAENGESQAQYSLALMYINGEGVAQNMDEAERWLTASAEQGYVAAENLYAELFGEDMTEYIDLGLPSGTLWAEENLGSDDDCPWGNLYQSGEITEDLPTYGQAKELIEQCEFYRGEHGGMGFWKVVGPNGNCIYFSEDRVSDAYGQEPCASCRVEENYVMLISQDMITIGFCMSDGKIPVRKVKP